MFLAVTTQATRIRILPRHRFKTDDLAYIPAALDVCGAGTMTGLATVSVFQSRFEVWSPLELVRVQILVACLARVAPNIFCWLILRRSARLLLTGGEGELNQQQQQEDRLAWRPWFAWFVLLQSWTPLAKKPPCRQRPMWPKMQRLRSTHFRVLMYSAIAPACSSLSPAMPLLCGALLEGSPFVIWSTS